jgi:replicative DNA helicase
MAVSVTEIAPRGEGFDRTPPHDVAAEQCVLGGMLLSKDAISDVMETIRPDDHYRPAHQIVHEAILELYGRGEPADPVTVSDLLNKRGELARVGGPSYLHTLIASVPTAANAGYYARIVRERAILRRLVEVGTRIVQLGYSGDGEADELVDRAQAEVYGVTERRVSEDYLSLSEIMPAALDEIEAIGSRGGGMTGVPTGFADLDALTNGLHPGQMVVIAARPAVGKALALSTPLPTPEGWTTMGEVRVGDCLVGADGRPATVVAATEVMHDRPCYEVEFSDGEAIVADGEHQWLTWTRAARRYDAQGRGLQRNYAKPVPPQVVTTEQIAATLRCATVDQRPNHAVQLARPLELPAADLPIPAYALGVWLGDGETAGARFTTADPEIAAAAEACRQVVVKQRARLNYGMTLPGGVKTVAERVCVVCGTSFVPKNDRVRTCGRGCGGKAMFSSPPVPAPRCPRCGGPRVGQLPSVGLCNTCWREHDSVQAELRTLGLLGHKHIPARYLRASIAQRRELLAGLLDTDGTVTASGSIQLAVTSRELAEGVRELVLSLGYRCSMATKRVKGRHEDSSTCYMVTFTTPDEVFRLPRKQLAHKEGQRHYPQRTRWRYIVDVRPVPSVPVRCVQVDNADHLYLAGRGMIPTHNSTLALDLARAATIKHGMPTVMFSLEMSRNEITMRLLSAEARVPLHSMRTGQMGEEDWTRLARRMSEVVDAPLFIDDSPNMSMMEIRAKCRRLKQRNDLKMVIVDYLQLMSSAKRVENRQQEVSDMSRSLKLLAKEIDVPVIAISQLNRGPEQRTDKKPLLSDLRESGCLTADTRILRADTGAEVTLGELVASGVQEVPVWSVDERLRLVPTTMTRAFPSGTKEVFRVRLRSGREVRATANHPFLTCDGWRPLGALGPGSRVGVARHTPGPVNLRSLPAEDVILLACQLGDGSPEQAIPDSLWSVPRSQLALFLRHLWGANGCIWWDARAEQSRIYYPSASRRLVDDIARLLLRFNVMTQIFALGRDSRSPRYLLVVDGTEDQLRFLDGIGIPGAGGPIAKATRERLRSVRHDAATARVPGDVWERVGRVLEMRQSAFRGDASAGKVWRSAASHSLVPAQKRPARGGGQAKQPVQQQLSRVVTILDDAELDMVATNDIFWDEIAAVESLGQQPVYDATVPGAHNFVANGISLHNSIEQDSDVVILLHREDAYERESPRAGEADLIVAKHRNGPTATVTVAFQGHYSRFVDMAPG